MGDDKTEGWLTVVVVPTGIDLTEKPDDPCDDHGFGGLSFSPDSVDPPGRKHGILLSLAKPAQSFAHEMGHVFGLVHTWNKEVGFNKCCNKDFSRTEHGKRSGNRINLMDHGLRADDEVWMNDCQTEKAADHRRRLLTSDGKTNYQEL